MGTANLSIVLPALVGLLVLLIGAIFFVRGSTSSSRKKANAKLNDFAIRYGIKTQSAEEAIRSIRTNQDAGGIGEALSSLIPRRDEMKARLSRAGMSISFSNYAMLCAGLASATFLLMLLLGMAPLFGIFAAIILGLGLPNWVVGKKIKARSKKFTSQFPEALDLMVRGLKSGLPVNEVMINVAQELSAPTGPEFQQVVDAIRLGETVESALWAMARRIDTPDVKFFVISLSVQRETGGNLAETLSNLTTILRQRQSMKLKVGALSSEAKASSWIVGTLPFIMYGLIMLLNYDYGVILITNPAGNIAAIGGLIWMGIGVFIMSRMINFEM